MIADRPVRHFPTRHPPGSEEKVDVLAARYHLGLPLWHPGDAGMDVLRLVSSGPEADVIRSTVDPNWEE